MKSVISVSEHPWLRFTITHAGRNGPQDQEWEDHPKATCQQNFSVANFSSAFGSSKLVGGRQATTVLLTNYCSLYRKLAEHNLLISSNEPSIINLTEKWLTPSFDDDEIFLSNLTIFRADRVQTRRGGGVALHSKSSLKPV